MQSQHCKVLAFMGVLGLHRAAKGLFVNAQQSRVTWVPSVGGFRGCL
mgnify:CR=1 FL=1